MTRRLLALAAALGLWAAALAAQSPTIEGPVRIGAGRLIDAALADTSGYSRLTELTSRFPARISGSPSLEQAIDWMLAQLQADGLANVHGEAVTVPHWVRGEESAALVAPDALPLHFLGLGGSIGTPPAGITAPVLVVTSFADLTAHAAEARGRIVVYDVAFPTAPHPLDAYEMVVPYRVNGASAAAKVGAVASLVRSLTPKQGQTPHTGRMVYEDGTPQIPSGALSVDDTVMLHRLQDRGETPRMTLKMQARTLPDVASRNVVAEIVGRERPDEIVVLGGHIDSWDVGQGAMDDGGGVLAAWTALRLMQAQPELRPRRTIRLVAWTNEENGTRGARGYFDAHASEMAAHVAAIESDGGVFRPFGFKFQGTPAGLLQAKLIGRLLERIGAGRVENGDSEADVAPLVRAGVPAFGLDVDMSRYFSYHHTADDTIGVINPAEFRRCVAAMAVLAYVTAETPNRLPRSR